MKLDAKTRRGILAGKAPSIKGKGKCPLERGQTVEITSKVAIRIERVRIPRGGGWSVSYTRIDHRDLFLIPSNRKISLNDYGEPMEMSEAEAHGMNGNPCDPVDAGPVLDARYQTVVSMSGRLKKAQQPTSQSERDAQARAFRERLHQTMRGLDPPAQMALMIELERTLSEAQQRRAA